jgi:hypothetical protein
VSAPAESAGGSRAWIAPGLLGLLLLYTAAIHHGVGPVRLAARDRWYTPTGFLLDSELAQPLLDPPGLAFVSLGLPALLLVAGVMITTRSAVAIAAAAACAVATLLFVFYGVLAPFPWQFFGWRASAVLVLIAVAIGTAVSAPLLAGSWLRLRPWLRAATWLPAAVLAIAFLRNATGTDASLDFGLSPWPAVAVFGLEVGALFAAIGWLATAAGLFLIDRAHGAPPRIAIGLLAAALLPALLLLAGSGLHLFPFQVGPWLAGGVALACCAAAAAAATLFVRGRDDLRAARARRIGVGALLVGVPLAAGQAWAQLDYYVTREVYAGRIIDALEAYLARETLYPDTLDELVAAGDLDAIPEPAIGFDALYDGRFEYQGFGTSYLLEFPAPRWVQCAYTPAIVYEEGEEEEYEGDGEFAAEDLLESWSCPSQPPELW